jgi:F420 biosynthesis protein FbiB-like protein
MDMPDQWSEGPSATVTEWLARRRSVRRYIDAPVPAALVDMLLQAACASPSAHNRQPWRFAVIEAHATKALLATRMGDRLREERTRDGDPLDAIAKDVERSYARITRAPVLVLVCLSMVDMDRYRDNARANAEHTMAVQGAAMAAQNILLAAHAAGLGASWMCAPLFCPETVMQVLDLPADWQPQALITLGYPAEPGRASERRPLAFCTQYLDRTR